MKDLDFEYIWNKFDFSRWKRQNNELMSCIESFATGVGAATGGLVNCSIVLVQEIGGWNEYQLMIYPNGKRELEKSILTFYSSNEYIALKKDSLDSSFCATKEIDKKRLFETLSTLATSNEVQSSIMRFMSYDE